MITCITNDCELYFLSDRVAAELLLELSSAVEL